MLLASYCRICSNSRRNIKNNVNSRSKSGLGCENEKRQTSHTHNVLISPIHQTARFHSQKETNVFAIFVILTIDFAITALDGPVIIAMVVNGTMPVEQEPVLAVFESQSAIRA